MQAVLQCPFAGEISLRAPLADSAGEGPVWAKVQAVGTLLLVALIVGCALSDISLKTMRLIFGFLVRQH